MSDDAKTDLFPPDRLPCISLWTPWANWVALGWKTIETRTHARFAKLVGHRIGIHYALRFDPAAFMSAYPYLTPAQRELSTDFLRVGGHVGCTAFVREVRWLTEADESAALIECRSVRRFGLFLENVKTLPVGDGVKGAQGIFYIPMPASATETIK
jgi:hypothetical protein